MFIYYEKPLLFTRKLVRLRRYMYFKTKFIFTDYHSILQ